MKPDWKKSSDYPPANGTSIHRWALEFLIRNNKFLAEYNVAAKDNPNDIYDSWDQSPIGKVAKRFGVIDIIPKGFRVTESRISPVTFQIYPKDAFNDYLAIAGGIFTNEDEGKYFYKIKVLPKNKVLEFDLSQPLKIQVERARRMLIDEQKSRYGKKIIGIARVELYQLYLRVLDAISDGISPGEICEVLSLEFTEIVSDDDVRNWKKKAEEIRDGGYLKLIQKSSSRKKKLRKYS
jgi:hypothetical protein